VSFCFNRDLNQRRIGERTGAEPSRAEPEDRTREETQTERSRSKERERERAKEVGKELIGEMKKQLEEKRTRRGAGSVCLCLTAWKRF
jgi:hypothetical protein